MQIILREDFPALGYVGDKVQVKKGYARNFLIPRGIAIEVNPHNASVIKHHLGAITAKKVKMKAEAEEYGKKIKDIVLEFTLKSSESGKTFGSITLKDISESFTKKGFEIDRKRLRLEEAIKGLGTFTVHVRLHSEVSIPVTVKVTEEVSAVAADGAKPEGKKKAGRGRKKKSDVATEGGESAEGAQDAEAKEEA